MNNFSESFSINKKSNNLLKYAGSAFGLVLFILVLNLFSSPIKNSFYFISSPVEKTFWSAGELSSGFAKSVFDAGALAQENDTLKNENQKLISEVTSLQAINDANQAQTNVSQSCQNSNFNLVMVGVIGLDGQDILSVNKGFADGLAVGMPVISQQGALYGKISKVFKNFSQIMLISNKDSVVNVKIQQPALSADASPEAVPAPEIDGVIKGGGNSSVYLDMIPVNNPISQGNILVTSSLEKTFPKDLLVGTISQVQRNDQKPFQQAKIQPFFNLNTADNLFVITNYKQK